MAFNYIETSDSDATAVFLYEFQIDENIWYYTAADSDIAAGGKAWEAASIEHDRVSQTGDADQDNVELTVPDDLIPAKVYIGSTPSQQMVVRFRKAHDGEPEAPIYWVGIVSSVDWPAPGRVVIGLIPLSATMQREGLTMTYQRGCRLALYGQGSGRCNVNKQKYKVSTKITAAGYASLKLEGIDGYAPGWFSGGFIEWEDPLRGREWRTVEASLGETVNIFGLTDGLYTDMNINIYPGCPRTMKACNEKFDNIDNYGGQPHLPGDSPFDGDPF